MRSNSAARDYTARFPAFTADLGGWLDEARAVVPTRPDPADPGKDSRQAPGLLVRLQRTGAQADWGRLVDLYAAHLFLWACRAGLPGPEAADLVRRVFDAMAGKLGDFHPGSPGGFRGWLRGLAQAQRRELLRQKASPAQGTAQDDPPPVPVAADTLWEAEYLPLLLRAAVEGMQKEVAPADWKAFWGVAVEGRSADDVARELGIPVAAAYAAEGHVLRRLRQELDGMTD
jgi:DNA-directed RNA polymerase specialized sigma24 family protein